MSEITTLEFPRRSGGVDLRALSVLFTLSLRQHLHGKRWMVTAVLFLLPAALALLLRKTSPLMTCLEIEFVTVFMFIPQALLPLAALLYASGIVQDEQEEQTITYLLVRPIPKWAIYLAKLAATLAVVVTLTAVFTALTFAAIYLGNPSSPGDALHRCMVTVCIHSLAVTSYCCLFGLMSMFTKRTLVAGIIYTVIVEAVLANLPLSVRMITIIYYTRLIAVRFISFVSINPEGGSHDLAAELWNLDIVADPKLSEHPQLITCFIMLLGGSLICALLASFICWQREFYVKTPEKA